MPFLFLAVGQLCSSTLKVCQTCPTFFILRGPLTQCSQLRLLTPKRQSRKIFVALIFKHIFKVQSTEIARVTVLCTLRIGINGFATNILRLCRFGAKSFKLTALDLKSPYHYNFKFVSFVKFVSYSNNFLKTYYHVRFK